MGERGRFLCAFNYCMLLLEPEKDELLKAIKEGSIIIWRHINFHGEYDFSEEKMQDSVGLNLAKILAWK